MKDVADSQCRKTSECYYGGRLSCRCLHILMLLFYAVRSPIQCNGRRVSEVENQTCRVAEAVFISEAVKASDHPVKLP